MNTNTNDTAYGTMTKSVISAVDYANKAENKWQSAGQAVRVYYPSRENLEGVKAQFIADAILPALDKKHAAALGVELPRKGSKEYNEMSEANRAKWNTANEAKKAARATCDTYFSRVLNYAFPKEKAESTPKSIEVKFNEALTDLIKACEKAEDAPFDVISVKACLVKAQKLVNSGILNQIG
jgi:hypothetical protein